MSALKGLKVIDLSESIAGQYCGRMMAGYGADVYVVEPPQGSVIRQIAPFSHSNLDSVTFFHLNLDKYSVVLDLETLQGKEKLLNLCKDADVVLLPTDMDLAFLRAEAIEAVFCIISEFDPSGPYANWKSDEMIHQALAGIMYQNGAAGKEPIFGCGNRASYLTGLAAYISVLSALQKGGGELVAVDVHKTATSASYHLPNQYFQNNTYDRRDGPQRTAEMVVQCKDGWAVIFVYPYRWEKFCQIMGLDALATNPDFATHGDRLARWAEIVALANEATINMAAEELVVALQKAGVPAAESFEPNDLFNSKHLHERNYWNKIEMPNGNRLAMGSPYLLAEAKWRAVAPICDVPWTEIGDLLAANHNTHKATNKNISADGAKSAPLAGLKVLDITTAWAGPMAGRILASLGAEVVHVEAATRMDLSRGSPSGEHPNRYADRERGERPFNRSIFFNSQNLNKKSLCIDIKKPGGAEALRAVAEQADIVFANFTPGTMARMGLEYAELAKINPKLIYMEMPAFGISGSMSKFSALGPNMEFVAGMAAFVGYGDGRPYPTGPAYLDPIGGYNGVAALLTALYQRKKTGLGQYIELSQCEAAMPMIGELILAAIENDEAPNPQVNRLPNKLIHRAFACRGEEEWVAISFDSQSEWEGLIVAMEQPELREDVRFISKEARLKNQAALEAVIAQWTQNADKHEIAMLLQKHGVAAAPVNHGKDIANDRHLFATGFFTKLTHPEAGTHYYQGLPFSFTKSRLPKPQYAPLLGEHSVDILREWAGYDEKKIEKLRETNTLGVHPDVFNSVKSGNH